MEVNPDPLPDTLTLRPSVAATWLYLLIALGAFGYVAWWGLVLGAIKLMLALLLLVALAGFAAYQTWQLVARREVGLFLQRDHFRLRTALLESRYRWTEVADFKPFNGSVLFMHQGTPHTLPEYPGFDQYQLSALLNRWRDRGISVASTTSAPRRLDQPPTITEA
jgi:hypothetical protein